MVNLGAPGNLGGMPQPDMAGLGVNIIARLEMLAKIMQEGINLSCQDSWGTNREYAAIGPTGDLEEFVGGLSSASIENGWIVHDTYSWLDPNIGIQFAALMYRFVKPVSDGDQGDDNPAPQEQETSAPE